MNENQFIEISDSTGKKPLYSKKLYYFSLSNWFKSLYSCQDSFLLSLLILFNGVLVLYELYKGYLLKSHPIICDSVHGIIHIGSFLFALIAFTKARKGSNLHYTYGYFRIETLSAFINAFLLLFLSAFAFIGKIHHYIEGHIGIEEGFLGIDILKVVFNLVGVICFMRYRRKKGNDESHFENFHTLFLHFLLDGLLNISNIVLFVYDWLYLYKMEFFLTGFIFTLTIILIRPVLQRTGLILLQAFPIKDEEFVSQVLREISVVEGVLNIKEKRFWGLHQGFLVCSMKILMRKDANKEESLKDIQGILKLKFQNVCIEFIFDK